MTRARDVADSQDNLGGAVAPITAGKNLVINGNFDIWQRGTSGFSSYSVYTADRWYNTQSANITGSRQSTTPPSGSQYVFRETVTAGGGYYTLAQYIETANVAALWGKTVTFSVKLRRSSTFDSLMFIDINKTSTVDGGSGATWTQVAVKQITAAEIPSGTTTADWTTFSVTATIPSDGTANGLYVRVGYLTNPANGSYIEIAQAQLEVGSVATPFSRAGGTLQSELAACQRYYYRVSGGTVPIVTSSGYTYSTTAGVGYMYLPSTMRVSPTAIEYSNIVAVDFTNATLTTTNITISGVSTTSTIGFDVTVSGATSGRSFYLRGNASGSPYLGLSAEL